MKKIEKKIKFLFYQIYILRRLLSSTFLWNGSYDE